ncbi:PREDICTED: leukocyte surface antigen CD47-like isoform X5 [Myotis brandtii]|uniref:leukocyte surface antigen CD47-like isoform X5 n=1 Tax=Myotis brandtii TaxID=109478 RepID=UPI0007042F80|nr:PREDICTED: leukocyte surface antigen CD47-like isoform X5 [Myotis brandtii]
MWPLLVLVLLGLASCGSAQLIFNITDSVEYTKDNKTILIPCIVNNLGAKDLEEMFVKWRFRGKQIFYYDGYKNESQSTSDFSSAYFVPDTLLSGNASLIMDKSDAVPGNYTCEVTELTREGETTIELKYRIDKTQLLFTTIESVDYTICNETLLTIPCLVTNVGAMSLKEMFVKWRLGDKQILFYDGDKNETNPISDFPSAYIIPNALLTGDASLMMDKSDAVPGNYTCEVTELTREGETTIELKYHIALWFSANDYVLTIIFPMLAVLLFWGSDIVTLKYNSNITKEKIIILSVAGLVLSILVIVGAVFFIPGEYSTKRASGLGLIVASTVILILLQISMFLIAPAKRKLPISVILLIVQVLGLLISVVGLSFCVSECIPVHGSLLISGLGITTLGALLGLVYMIFVAGSKQNTIHPQTDKKNRSDGL